MRSLISSLFLAITLLASGKFLSPLPLPTLTIINLDTYECDSSCLEKFLQNEQYFSFLAHLNSKNIEQFKSQYQHLLTLFHLKSLLPKQKSLIALYCHQKTRSICNHLAKAITSYYLSRHQVDFAIYTTIIDNNTTFSSIVYDPQMLNILIATYNDSQDLANLEANARFFIPTLHISLVQQSKNLYFAGVDYRAQIVQLLQLNSNSLAIFYLKKSPFSSYLTHLSQENCDKPIKLYPVDSAYGNLKHYLKGNSDLNSSALLLHTPPVKTSLILSQLPLYGIEPPIKLSTQINFTAKLFSLIQPDNRKELYIAHILSSYPKDIDAYASLLDENLFYNWIDYATIVGIDSFFATMQNAPKKFKEEFIGNQIQYEIQIDKTTPYGFEAAQIAPKSGEEF